jgi:type I restriction enzyme S subunit
MVEWQDLVLGDVIELKRGYDLPQEKRRDGCIPIVSSSGVSGAHAEAKCSAPGVVTGRYGTIGQVFYLTEDFWPLNTTLYVRDFKGNDPRFISYFLQQIDFLSCSDKAAVPGVNRNHLHAAKVALPPLSEQKAIAHILGTLDDKIELNRKMNVTLEAMARALFQSWFVDFDPVRAKQEGRTPDGLDEATAALFPDSFEDSELGPIPKGWRVTRIDEVAKINDWTLSKNDALETLEYIEISEVSAGNVGNITTYNRGEEPSRARRRLRHGDTVLSTVRPDRRSYFISLNPPENRIVSTGFAVVTPTKVPWSFVHSTLTRDEVFERLGHLADGAAYPAVRPEVIGALKVAVPTDPSLLNAFHIACGSLFMRAESNREQSRTLATLRDTLLPKLLSGELSTSRMKRRHFYEAD